MFGRLGTLATVRRNRSLPPEELAALQLRKLRAVIGAACQENAVSERLASQVRLTLHTSGTTGVPLAVWLSADDLKIRSLAGLSNLMSLGFGRGSG